MPSDLATPDDAEQVQELALSFADVECGLQGQRLGVKTVKALEMMAYEGASPDIAAETHGLLRHNLIRAYNTPAVRKAYNQIVRALRENAGQQAYMRIARLSQQSASDHVRLEGNKWIAGVDNIAPVRRVEGKYQVNHSFGGFEFEDPTVINGQSHDTTSEEDDD